MYYNSCLSGHYYSTNGCAFQEMCCIPPKHTIYPPLKQGQCGVSTPVPERQTKIVGGKIAAPGEFPWQVSMRSNGHHVCGGIMVGDQWVMTAAHCFKTNKNPYAWTVVLGEHDRAVLEGYEILEKVETLFIHSHFDPAQFLNDIALIKLGNPVTVDTAYVRPVCIPNKNESFDGMICTITGWGASHSGGVGTHNLYKADVPLLSNEVCSYLMDRTIPNTELCAGRKRGGVDSCQGDSGGPMVCKKNGVWNIVGIVSWGYSCAQAYTPGVYTRVQSYLDWVHSVMSYYGSHPSQKRGLHYV
ncbi:hypothetical protein FSP39_002121 [Pinctada imbricata]|uniref:Peptidase S1 domain-containing protein n=2 Tax=Pinctada TaxID=50425 RepID=A0AA89BXV4_PINIB|nr:hypothetical protein FSP39_002121 [Pinctada imbricata]